MTLPQPALYYIKNDVTQNENSRKCDIIHCLNRDSDSPDIQNMIRHKVAIE